MCFQLQLLYTAVHPLYISPLFCCLHEQLKNNDSYHYCWRGLNDWFSFIIVLGEQCGIALQAGDLILTMYQDVLSLSRID